MVLAVLLGTCRLVCYKHTLTSSCFYIPCTTTMKMEATDSSRIFVSFNRATNQRTVNVMVYKH